MKEEASKPTRRNNGTFQEGQSGNPSGRPAQSKRIPHPEEFRDRVFSIAQHTTTVTVAGKKIDVTLYERNMLTLGTAGGNGDVKAAIKFIDAVDAAAAEEQRIGEDGMKRLKGITPAYEVETDPKKRAILKAAWEYNLDHVNGRRETRVKPLRQRKRRR